MLSAKKENFFRLRINKMFVVVRSLNICLLIKLYEY